MANISPPIATKIQPELNDISTISPLGLDIERINYLPMGNRSNPCFKSKSLEGLTMDDLLILLLALLMLGLLVCLVGGSILLWKKALNHFRFKTDGMTKSNNFKTQMSLGWRIFIKLALIATLSLVLLFPLNMVKKLTNERESLSDSVVANISGEWGLPQIVSGPFLVVPITFSYQVTERVPLESRSPVKVPLNLGQNQAPYQEPVNQAPSAHGQAVESFDHEAKASGENSPAPEGQLWANGQIVDKIVYLERTNTRLALIAPRNLKVTGDFSSQERKRGIYKAQVYSAKLRLAGDFKFPSNQELAKLDLNKQVKSINWAEARFLVGLSDVTAILRAGPLNFDQKSHDFRPESKASLGLPSGFSAPLNLQNRADLAAFDLELDFAGSGSFHLAVVSQSTDLAITSNWPHPSFSGTGLPLERIIGKTGFEANWTVPDLVHSHPEVFLLEPTVQADDENENEYLIGVRFIKPVDDYRVIVRAIKFGAIFIILTFLTLVVSDLSSGKWTKKKGRELHPLQYVMVGLALVLFYLITLTLSEHLGLALAYFLASLTTILMIGGYAYSASGSRNLGLLVTCLTALLYGVLYLILRQEDYALLSGTILLVAVLVALMILTRKVNGPDLLEQTPIEPAQSEMAQAQESPVPNQTPNSGS
ncbi:MAG: cell envelope integrity protein CreD [Deltaproteobacteria bacterium]|jgi:inner membrane protein|nr:cell envelope integrity protein CreD [Deltaproteobacteria bacterium]